MDVRLVRLREPRWWRYGVRPVIAFRAADRQPVALFPVRFGSGYTLVDAEGTRTRLDEAHANLLDREAFMLYGRIPVRINSLGGVIGNALAEQKPALCFLAAMSLASALALATAPRWLAAFAAVALLQLIRSRAALRLTGQLKVSLVPGISGRVLRASLNYFHRASADDVALAAGSGGIVSEVVGTDIAEFATAFLAAIGAAVIAGPSCKAAHPRLPTSPRA